MERLSHLIEGVVHTNNRKGIEVAVGGPVLSHLMFADDVVLFAEATKENVMCIKNCLQ